MLKGSAFISYRREDTAGYAGRLYDRLNARFPDRIFMDVSGLDPGVDFVEEIQKAVGSCKALIVLIGKHWAVTSEGKERLQDPHDFVRIEVAHALERKIRVVPILVGRATLPAAETLPPEMHSLLRRQALELDDSAFDYHVAQLIETLEKDLGPAFQPAPNASGPTAQPAREQRPTAAYPNYEATQPKKTRRWLWLALGAAGVLGLLALALIGYISDEFSASSVDPEAVQAVTRALDSASNPPANATSSSAETGVSTDRVAPGVTPPRQTEPPTVAFNPVGRWRISAGDGAPVSLLVTFDSSGQFAAQSEGQGFSIPASAGAWAYSPSQRMLTATGVNNLYAPFTIQFQNISFHDGHFHAFVPGTGQVELVKE